MTDENIVIDGQGTGITTAGGQEPQPQNVDFEAEKKALKNEAAKYRIELKKIKDELEAERNLKLSETGQFKELYEKESQKVRELEALSLYKEKYDNLEKSLKTQLLEQLPASRRAEYENFGIEVLQVVIKDISKASQSVGTEGTNQITADMKWGDMNDEQRQSLYQSNPGLANKLMTEDINNKRRL